MTFISLNMWQSKTLEFLVQILKKTVKIYSANALYLIINKINGYIDEINGKKYLTLVPTNESKEILKKYEKLWTQKRDHFRIITNNSDH